MKIRHVLFTLSLIPTVFLFGCQENANMRIDNSIDMTTRMITVTESNVTNMLEEIKPAIVGIEVSLTGGYAVGSGVALADGGYILTNQHVVENGKDIKVYFADLSYGKATKIWSDAGLDLAIIKSERNIPYLQTRDSQTVRVGEDVYAIGTPLTLQFKHTVTRGIVSALNRTLEVDNSGDKASYLQSLIQHDASINPGNSGGPLISQDGKVIGINTLKANAEGIGFAIPIEVATAIVKRIVEDNNYTPPYLGIFGFDTNIAETYGETFLKSGVYVISTAGPSLEAGIKKGDIIKKIQNYEIKDMLDLRTVIYNFNAGDKISVSYIRNGEENTVEINSTDRK